MREYLKIGDVVTFREKKSLLNITGEIKELFYRKDLLYIRIYSFFLREEILYILNEKNELIKPKKYFNRKIKDMVIYDFSEDNKTSNEKIRNFIIKIISIILILIFLFSYVPIIHFSSMYDYKTFLSGKYSLNELFYAVIARINYQSDFDEFWNTPQYAWNKKAGDCEEMSSIISDYLNHNDIENYLSGLSIKNSVMGHAVVFARYNGFYYIIDPTRALEKAGVKKLEKARNLKEAVLYYSGLPAYIYKVPSFEGEKVIIAYVE